MSFDQLNVRLARMQNDTLRITASGSYPSGGIAPHGEASTLKASGTASAMANG